jgi:hypothetical protein
MLKNISKLEFQISDKSYHFLCDQDSPIDHVKEALFQFSKFIGQFEDGIKKAKLESEEKQKEEKSIGVN